MVNDQDIFQVVEEMYGYKYPNKDILFYSSILVLIHQIYLLKKIEFLRDQF